MPSPLPSASVILDANGNGQVTLTPNSGPPVWNISKVTVVTSRIGAPPVPRFALYLDDVIPGNQHGNTYDGSFNESDISLTIQRGQRIIGVWTGGLSGDTATMALYGTATAT